MDRFPAESITLLPLIVLIGIVASYSDRPPEHPLNARLQIVKMLSILICGASDPGMPQSSPHLAVSHRIFRSISLHSPYIGGSPCLPQKSLYISLYIHVSPYISVSIPRSPRISMLSPYMNLTVSPYISMYFISMHLPIYSYIFLYLPISSYISRYLTDAS